MFARQTAQPQQMTSVVHPHSTSHGTHGYDSPNPEELNSKCHSSFVSQWIWAFLQQLVPALLKRLQRPPSSPRQLDQNKSISRCDTLLSARTRHLIGPRGPAVQQGCGTCCLSMSRQGEFKWSGAVTGCRSLVQTHNLPHCLCWATLTVMWPTHLMSLTLQPSHIGVKARASLA